MILTDNTIFLRKNFPSVAEYLKTHAIQSETHRIMDARNGLPTLAIGANYLHSRYDPRKEAAQFVDGINADGQHFFIYGVGLGYHIQALHDKYPGAIFTILEPDVQIFTKFLEVQDLTKFPRKIWADFYIGAKHVDVYLHDFVSKVKGKVDLVILPSYERAFPEETAIFYQKFKESIEIIRRHFITNKSYEKLWIINSVKNFEKVLSTPSILREKTKTFQDKPVIIAAAGPSLQDEFENLRYIKENRLAYIFAVGSANKALIAQGIYPDVLTTYDPNPHNILVYEELLTQKIDQIPLVFGSSVDHNTVQYFTGPMLHMITSQDTISHYFLNGDNLLSNREVVSDAPSIAVLTLEILSRLKVSHIILVGQNLANRGDQYYASGVNYSYRASEFLTQAEKDNQIFVESVDGGQVFTDQGNNSARLQMEHVISTMPKIPVINTTKGGAKIAGTSFVHLDNLIKEILLEPVVDPKWYLGEATNYDKAEMIKRTARMEKSSSDYIADVTETFDVLKKIESYAKKRDTKQLEKQFVKFDKAIAPILKNDFFNVFVRPMFRVKFEVIHRSVKMIYKETDTLKKANMVIETFLRFLNDCKYLHNECLILFQHIKTVIERHTQVHVAEG